MTTNIEYIGHRPEYKDTLYGTGTWTKGQIKPVTDQTATRMAKHPDQYRIVEAPKEQALDIADLSEEKTEEQKAAEAEADEAQAAREAIANMDKASVLSYVEINFRQKLDHRLGLDKLRAAAVQLVDQYGAT